MTRATEARGTSRGFADPVGRAVSLIRARKTGAVLKQLRNPEIQQNPDLWIGTLGETDLEYLSSLRTAIHSQIVAQLRTLRKRSRRMFLSFDPEVMSMVARYADPTQQASLRTSFEDLIVANIRHTNRLSGEPITALQELQVLVKRCEWWILWNLPEITCSGTDLYRICAESMIIDPDNHLIPWVALRLYNPNSPDRQALDAVFQKAADCPHPERFSAEALLKLYRESGDRYYHRKVRDLIIQRYGYEEIIRIGKVLRSDSGLEVMTQELILRPEVYPKVSRGRDFLRDILRRDFPEALSRYVADLERQGKEPFNSKLLQKAFRYRARSCISWILSQPGLTNRARDMFANSPDLTMQVCAYFRESEPK